MIVTDNPVIFRRMAAARSPFVKCEWFRGMNFDPRVDNILFMQDEEGHKALREKLMPGEFPTLESDINKRVVELISLIREHVDSGKTFMFAGYFTLDSLTQVAFGNARGFLAKNEDLYHYIKSSTDYYFVIELGSNHPFVLNILSSRFMQVNAAPKPDDKVGVGPIISVAHEAVAERYGPDAKHVDDMIGSFVKHGLTQTECESETFASDPGWRGLNYHRVENDFPIYSHQPVRPREAAHGDQVNNRQWQRVFPVIKDSEAKNLLYLQACIKGLRMYQPLCGLATRLSPPGGATINGVFIPRRGRGWYRQLRDDEADRFLRTRC